MTSPYSPSFPLSGVDAPVVVNAAYEMDANDRRGIDSQIRNLQSYAISVSSTTLPDANASLVQAQVLTQVVNLVGTLTAGRQVTVPTQLGQSYWRYYVNQTAQTLTLVPSTGGASSLQILAGTGGGIYYDGVANAIYPIGSGGGGGASFGHDLTAITGTTQKVVGFNGTPLTGSPSVGQSKVYIYDAGSTNLFSLRQLSTDDLAAAFTPTLVQASGGAGPFEVGQGFTPTFTPTPLGNAANLTAASASDNQGNGPVSFLGSSGNIAAPVGGGTYTINAPATVVVTASWTQAVPSVTKTASVTLGAVQDRGYWGVGGAGATSATYSGGNATLSGGSSGGASLAGALVSAYVGSSSPSLAPSTQKIYFLCRHTATPHTFKDQNGFGVPFNAPTTFNMTNGFSLSISMDLYESANLLNPPVGIPYTITVLT